jgi:2'-5' RNA ligase
MSRRVFAAIDISEDARRAATEYVARLRAEFPDASARWERPEKLHITVKFAGTLDEEQFGIFTERVEAAARSVEAFQIKLSGTGAFLKSRGPIVLWLGVEQLTDGDPIGRIAAELAHKGRSFHPHVTIARIKDAKKAKELIERHQAASLDSEAFEVNEIVIYESELFPTGSLYRRLNGFILSVI